MYERFTDRARTVMQLANWAAQRFNQEDIGTVSTEHILFGLLEEGSGLAANALRNLGIDLGRLYQEIEKIAQPGPYQYRRDRLPLTPRVKAVLIYANEEAELLDASEVGTGHLLLALVRQPESGAAHVLINMGLKLEDVRGEVLRLFGREIPVEKASNIPPRPKPVPSSSEPDNLVVMEKEAMYERFTDRARKVMQLANQEAQRFNHEYIGTEHILLGLVKEGSGVAANVLKNLDIDLRKIRLEVEKIVQSGPDMVTIGRLPQTPMAKKVIDLAIEEARNLNHNYVGTEHLLLGLLREQETVASQVLMNLGLKLSDVRKEVLQVLGYELASEESYSGRTLVRRWSRKSRNPSGLPQEERSLSEEQQRLRSLEQQLWNVRVVLGALAGALVGALLFASVGAVIGLLVGGVVAALGWRILGILAGGGAGALLGCVHLMNEWGGLAGALLGALAGFLIAEIGGPSDRRGFLDFWRKR